MKYSADKQEHYAVLELQEEKLDATVAPGLKGELVMLTNEGTKNIILDLQHVKYADSSGLSALLVGNRLCHGVEGVFVLTNLQESLQKLVNISHLEDVLEIIPTRQEAQEAVFMHVMEGELEDGQQPAERSSASVGENYEEAEEEELWDDMDDDTEGSDVWDEETDSENAEEWDEDDLSFEEEDEEGEPERE